MLNANISKENKQQIITAAGSVPELMNDIAVLVNGIYNQFKAASPASADLFRNGLTNMFNDPNGSMWGTMGNQTGITFIKPEE